jgi:hypothetical protein
LFNKAGAFIYYISKKSVMINLGKAQLKYIMHVIYKMVALAQSAATVVRHMAARSVV